MPSGAPSARRAERCVVTGASLPEHRCRAEHCQRAERSIVTGASMPSGAPSVSGAKRHHWSIDAERSTISERSGVPSAEHRAERSTVSERSGATSAEHRAEWSIEPNGAQPAEQLAERSNIGTATVQRAERSTVSRAPLASRALIASRASSGVAHRQRRIVTGASEPSGALSARRAEYRQRAERSIVTGASELSGAPSGRRAEHPQRAERDVVSEPSRASSPEHRERSIEPS
jgi:hypothetical protein